MPLLSPDLAATLNRWPRRLAATLLLLLAAGSALAARRHPPAPAAPAATPVVVAARYVAVGHTLVRADLTVAQWPPALVPAGTVPDAARLVGRRVSGPLGRGEPVTGTRLVGADLAAGLPAGELAVPVTLADPTAEALIRPGDVVDLIAVAGEDAAVEGAAAVDRASAGMVAAGVRVLAVFPAEDDQQGGVGLVVAANRAGALRLAAVAARRLLAVRDEPP